MANREHFYSDNKTNVGLAKQKAEIAHQGQLRKSGEPYITHPEAVHNIIANEWGIQDEELRCAAWLHDTSEDTTYKLPQIEGDFGTTIANLVDGVTKAGSTKETHRKGVEAMYEDPRTLILKLADRLANTRTLEHLSPEKQFRIATETLSIYCPMAASIGLWRVKTELEDLSFKCINPLESTPLSQTLEKDQRWGTNFSDYMTSQLERVMKEANLEGQVNPRKDGIYAINKAVQEKGLRDASGAYILSGISDVISFRTTFKTLDECYLFLGRVHKAFGQQIKYPEFNEYVGANARLNGYQSIQTTISTPVGDIEVAIATLEQEAFNDWGIIDQLKKGRSLESYRRKWVFTPDDEVVFFKPEATALDLAYYLYPSLGAMGDYALIDEKPKSMSSIVPNGSTVKIITSHERTVPEPSLLQYCLPETQKIIYSQLEADRKNKTVQVGRLAVNELLSKLKLPNLEHISAYVTPLLPEIGCNDLNELYFKVGTQSEHYLKKIEEVLKDADITNAKGKLDDEVYTEMDAKLKNDLLVASVVHSEELISKYQLEEHLNFVVALFSDLPRAYKEANVFQKRSLLCSIWPSGLSWNYPSLSNTAISSVFEAIKSFEPAYTQKHLQLGAE